MHARLGRLAHYSPPFHPVPFTPLTLLISHPCCPPLPPPLQRSLADAQATVEGLRDVGAMRLAVLDDGSLWGLVLAPQLELAAVGEGFQRFFCIDDVY